MVTLPDAVNQVALAPAHDMQRNAFAASKAAYILRCLVPLDPFFTEISMDHHHGSRPAFFGSPVQQVVGHRIGVLATGYAEYQRCTFSKKCDWIVGFLGEIIHFK